MRYKFLKAESFKLSARNGGVFCIGAKQINEKKIPLKFNYNQFAFKRTKTKVNKPHNIDNINIRIMSD